jgi:light-regulated signal transduction histidine kinase (bacteriophytochrome)
MADNEIVGRVWSFRDVTEPKRLEAEIKELNVDLEKRVQQRTLEINKLNEELKSNVQSLELANKELDSFSYSVSHDLRAPLRAINGFASLLGKKATNLDEDSKKFLKVITDNVQKMNQLIEDLLAFSHVGKNELAKTDLDMNELVREVLDGIDIHERNENTELIVGDLLPANGDRNLLKQVFVNLISNAVKYSSKKEKPMIQIGSYASENQQENVYFVKDNGVGFDMKYYDKLFKVFQRIHSAEDFEGVGIGLAIVQRVVMKHGGKVWAEATENVGATFSFTLPVVSPAAQEPPKLDHEEKSKLMN